MSTEPNIQLRMLLMILAFSLIAILSMRLSFISLADFSKLAFIIVPALLATITKNKNER